MTGMPLRLTEKAFLSILKDKPMSRYPFRVKTQQEVLK